jgi:hypothetical protein
VAREPGKFGAWVRRNSPRREELIESRWLRPFAHRIAHSELWRFTRRSVPRGVALGLFVGIFLLIPGVQIVGVAMLALPCRANIPIGAAMTFLSNPATTPFLLAASIFVGNKSFGLHADMSTLGTLYSRRLGSMVPVGRGAGTGCRAVHHFRCFRCGGLCDRGICLALVDRRQVASARPWSYRTADPRALTFGDPTRIWGGDISLNPKQPVRIR